MSLREVITEFIYKSNNGQLDAIKGSIAGIGNALRRSTTQMTALNRQVESFGSKLRFIVEAYLGKRTFDYLITDYANTADAARKASEALGISSDAIQEFGHAAGLGGSNQEEFINGARRLARVMNDASKGMKTAQSALSGIEFQRAGQLLPLDNVIAQIADRFAGMSDATKRAALSQELFGKAGTKLIPMLKGGSKELAVLRRDARFGVISEQQARVAEEYKDQLQRAKLAVAGLRNQLAAKLLPELVRVLTSFQTWVRSGDNAKRLLESLAVAAKIAAAALATLLVVKVAAWTQSLITGLTSVIASIRALGMAGLFAKAKLALLVGSLALLYLLLDDIKVFMRGGESVIGDMFGGTNTAAAKAFRAELGEIFAALKAAWAELAPLFKDLWAAIKPAIVQIWEALKPILPSIKTVLKFVITALSAIIWLALKVVTWIGKGISAAFNAIKDAWSSVTEWISDAWETLKETWYAIVDAIASALNKIREVWDTIVSALKAAWDAFVGALSAAWDAVVGFIKRVWDGFIKGVYSVGSAIKSMFTAIADSIGWVFKKAYEIGKKVYDFAVRVADLLSPGSLAGDIEAAAKKHGIGMSAPIGFGARGGSSVNVGGVSVTVNGTTTQTAEELAAMMQGQLLNVMFMSLANYRQVS